ncbi:thermonuclease family protein [Bosea sp. 2YAB26]|uniref:thermonuclease family protein n=1 Tax=Bosea sp. 2YAB26 TaxID=3237478 RepID=UPI003F9307E3
MDAPETGGAKCADEAALGQRATFRLAELLSSRPFRLEAIGSRDVDSYGRKLRIVANGGGSIGAQLVDEGLARPWNGGRRPWC